MRKACVAGWPVAHSLSPVIHRFWLKIYGVDGDYEAVPVTVEDFAGFLRSLPTLGFNGANVTLPHKVTAFQLCEFRDAAASAIGAVNTVWFEQGKLCGSNTDAFGFLANLDEAAPGWDESPRHAVVIGAGGAARAIVWALQDRGIREIVIMNRTLERAAALAASFKPARCVGFDRSREAMDGAGLVVNTSSLGMTGFGSLDVELAGVETGATVCDIVYNPLETSLLQNAKDHGLRCVDGLGMLLHQAAPGFEKWFGVRPAVTPALRDAVMTEMARRQSERQC